MMHCLLVKKLEEYEELIIRQRSSFLTESVTQINNSNAFRSKTVPQPREMFEFQLVTMFAKEEKKFVQKKRGFLSISS